MRIGEFVKKTGLTPDAVRHYIDMGLITPERTGAHYHFTAQCEKDALEIRWLKEHGFTLDEIKRLLLYRRITNLKTREDTDIYEGMMMDKRNNLMKEKERLERIISELNPSHTMTAEPATIKLGLPMAFVQVSACPACGGRLKLNGAQVENDMILEGRLACRCGYHSKITDGILIQKVDFKRHPAISVEETSLEYQNKTDPAFINLMYSANEWIINRSREKIKPESMILEPGTGGGIFLRHFIELIPENALYIAVDHDYETLKCTKDYLQKSHAFSNLAFICCEFNEIPIHNGCADILFDIYGSSGYNISRSGSMLDVVGDKVKAGAFCMGTLFCFDKNSKTLRNIPPEKARQFAKDEMEKNLWKSPFSITECTEIGYADKAGPSEPFFAEGDRIYVKVYTGYKKG